MARTRIKVCGVMRAADAAMACEAGADAVGVIFHPPARRCIDLATAGRIAAAIGPFITPVGVFVNAPVDTILQIAHTLPGLWVQLHGQETPESVRPVVEARLRIIKALRVDHTLKEQIGQWSGIEGLAGIVLETAGQTPGGAGIANDWNAIIAHQQRGLFDGLRIILAGGLHPDNVYEVVRSIRPWAVDVSSGTEETLGVKSHAKVHRFVSEVRRADDTH